MVTASRGTGMRPGISRHLERKSKYDFVRSGRANANANANRTGVEACRDSRLGLGLEMAAAEGMVTRSTGTRMRGRTG